MGTLGNILHVNFFGCAHWFMSIRMYQMKYFSNSVDQARYSTSIVAKYLDNSKVKASKTFYKTTFPPDMILTKDDTSKGYGQHSL